MHIKFGGRKILVAIALVVISICPTQAFSLSMYHNFNQEYASDSVIVSRVIISGNKVTKARVILNELEFNVGDTMVLSDIGQYIARSRDNLLNTSLFNFVYVTYAKQEDGRLIFQIRVDERWYWWVFPIFEYADRNLSSFLDNGDWSRVNYGIYIKRDNFRGRKEMLKLRLRLGFSSQFSVRFDSPEYRRKTGWGMEVDFRTNNSMPFQTIFNKPQFLVANDVVQYNYHSSVNYSWRPSLYQRHQLILSHTAVNVNDTVVMLNPNYLTEGDNQLQYLSLSYQYQFDKRDSKVYPLKGTNLWLQISQMGCGVLTDELSDLSLKLRFQQFESMAPSWHWGTTIEGRVGTSSTLPYVVNQGLGYKTYMNGYELYVIDGVKNAMIQNKLMFTLLKPKIKTLGFVPLTQFAKIHYAFYLKAYFDCGYAWQEFPNPTNSMANEWQYGYGAGVDLVTFYDKILSCNYSMNKLGQHGFFVHLNLEL